MPVKLLSNCLLCVALVCAARGAARAQGGPPAPGEPRPALRGVVVDQRGAPVAGAVVMLVVRRSVDVTGAQTDAEGRFEFPGPAPFPFTLTVTAEGFGPAALRREEGEWKGEELRVVLLPPSYAERVTVTASRTETRLAETAASVVVLGAEELETAAALAADDV
ncbi:MAG TPA: carboxypeptidase-like regulatory domain-containing protein, partial [Pyrinomonadaceae bacterium]